MTFIAQFTSHSPRFVRSPSQEGIDLPLDHSWDDSEQHELMTNGVIDTSKPIEVGPADTVKGDLMFPLRFARRNDLGQDDRVEIWYSSQFLKDGEILYFDTDGGVSIIIREM